MALLYANIRSNIANTNKIMAPRFRIICHIFKIESFDDIMLILATCYKLVLSRVNIYFYIFYIFF